MSLQQILAYGLAAVVIIWLAFRKSGHVFRTGDISGLFVGGNNSGTMVQNNPPPASPAAAPQETKRPEKDRVAWIIGIIAALIAAAQLLHDIYWK